MIGLVRLALRRPYTSAIAAMLILLLGALSVTRMIVDIFPVIDIPVVLVVWNYNGLTTEDMERRVVFISERAYSTTVNGISRIESQSIPSIGILKVYFQPGTDIGGAIAQISSVNNSILRSAPPGMQPPGVIQFNASNVPVVQMTLSSKTLTEQQIFDYSLNFIRIRLFTIPGLSTPGPFGGKSAPDQRRSRSVTPGGQGLLAGRRGERPAGLQRHRPGRHRAHRRPRIQRAVELQPEHGGPVQRVADRRVQRRAGHPGRRGACQRQLRHPDQRRARQRQARGLSRHPEARRCLHACRGGRRTRRAAGDPGGGAGRPGPEARLRPVGVRARRGAERDPRGDHLVDPGLGADPGVPGKLAKHGDRVRPRSRCRSSPA